MYGKHKGEIMKTNFESVKDFRCKFGLDVASTQDIPRLLPTDYTKYRLRFMLEEIEELTNAYDNDDLVEIADALVDLVYVILGTAHAHFLPWEKLFAEVQHANMTKLRASSARESKRNNQLDVVKPKGWLPPNIEQILVDAGWSRSYDK